MLKTKLDETTLIARFVRRFPRARVGGRELVLGIGDDAALIRPTPRRAWVLTTDAVRDGVHFGPLFRPREIGHKALAVNLSDLAAMGAVPRFFLCALELPAKLPLATLDGLAEGMATLARQAGCVLIGGNITRSLQLGITITAVGEVEASKALRRDRLRPGDTLAVTGRLGGAAFGLAQLQAGSRRGAGAQLKPTPRLDAGQAALDLARVAIDVSDGLVLDVARLATASRVRVDLTAKAIPVASGASLQQALSGGEDYELVFGLPTARLPVLTQRLKALGVTLSVVGRARKGRGVYLDGVRQLPTGFDHLSAPATGC